MEQVAVAEDVFEDLDELYEQLDLEVEASELMKGNEEKSGGLAMNIGIHFFDLLLWLFGPAQRSLLHRSTPASMADMATSVKTYSVRNESFPDSLQRPPSTIVSRSVKPQSH